MATLQERIMTDLKTAMKNKDALRKGVLTLLKAALQNDAIKFKRALKDDEEVAVIKREINQCRGLITEAEKANRTDIVENEKNKVTVLETYLPTMLTEDEIVAYLTSKGVQKGAHEGKTMGILMAEYKAKVDGTFAKEVIAKHFGA